MVATRGYPYLRQAGETYGGDYVEIGTRNGDSVVAVGEYFDSLTAIDPMETLGPLPGYDAHELGNEELFWANIEEAGLTDKTRLIVTVSLPWPDELKDDEWNVGFIDGEHTYIGLLKDLYMLAPRIKHCLILDDITEGGPHGGTLAAATYWLSQKYPQWELISDSDLVWVLKRK